MPSINIDCPQIGSWGIHSNEYYDDGQCTWCGAHEKSMCAYCSKPLGKSFVTSSFGSWHIECAPHNLIYSDDDHYP